MFCFEIAATWVAGVLRGRFGWDSLKGKAAWLCLLLPASVGTVLAQLWVYWRLTGRRPFSDYIVTGSIITEGVIGLSIVIYFAYKFDPVRKNKDR